MKIPYLGRISFYWCHRCNVPVLDKSCGACNESTSKIEITPPGDVRPAFNHDIELINRAAERRYGTPIITDERLVLLNSVPGIDRFEEVVSDGWVLGALRYDIKEGRHEFMPRIEGAMRMLPHVTRSVVWVAEDAQAHVIKNRSVLLPGVTDFDEHIKEGQEVIVACSDRVVGVGRARFSGKEALQRKKGFFVKLRKVNNNLRSRVDVPEGGQDFELACKANEHVLKRIELEALRFIRGMVDTNQGLPIAVSFSGGKDSLATLLLVRKVLEPKVVFVDTGIEFPETLEYIEMITQELGLDMITVGAEDRFWRGLDVFGMSGRDYRWCCKICKLGPVARLMYDVFPEGFLNFIGQRRYESKIRAKSGSVWRNKWLPGQLAASPVQNWNALHIWLYLFREAVPLNPLYYLGFERIGCWVCPSSSLSEFDSLKELHPALWRRFEKRLITLGYKREEIEQGLWRWRQLPKAQDKLRSEIGAGERNNQAPLPAGPVDPVRGAELASAIGVEVSKAVLMRSTHCLGCGLCLAHCDSDAIEFREGRVWINSRCIGCKRCHSICPIVKFLYEYNYN